MNRERGWDERDYKLRSAICQLPSYGLVANDPDNPMLARKDVLALLRQAARDRLDAAKSRAMTREEKLAELAEKWRKWGEVTHQGCLRDYRPNNRSGLRPRIAKFGGFLESILDRYADLMLFLGLLVYFVRVNRFSYAIVTGVAMAGAVMVGYAKARAAIYRQVAVELHDALALPATPPKEKP